MQNIEISKEILTSFTGAVFALLSAGFIWFLKSLYEKYRNEKLALAKFERIFANNLTILKDNFEFVDKWIEALKNDRPYSFYLGRYFIDDETTFKISNLELINSILTSNYKLRRTDFDLDNIYKNYWEIIFKIDAISDPAVKDANLKQYHQRVIEALEQIKLNYKNVHNELVETVALIRVIDKVKFHSLFGYLNLLFIDVFPRVTKKSKELEVKKLKKNIEEKMSVSPARDAS